MQSQPFYGFMFSLSFLKQKYPKKKGVVKLKFSSE